MKKKVFGSITALAIVAVAVFNVSLGSKSGNLSGVSLANVEALADDTEDGGSNKWFSNLNWVECTISKTNGSAAFYYRGVLIAAKAEYTYYGNKKVCERELTLNTCNTSYQTPCQ